MTAAHSVVLATRSRDKAREIRDVLSTVSHIAVVTLEDAGIAEDPAEESIEAFDSFLENAHAKAAYFMKLTRRPVIADDSGISVSVLGGAPGVRSRRFAQQPGLTGLALDRANNERLLHELRNTPPAERLAHYSCAAVMHLPDGRRFSAVGTTRGVVLDAPRGTGGFGYDPLFLLPAIDRTFGELTLQEKQRHSHRARAFRALAGALPVLDHAPPFR